MPLARGVPLVAPTPQARTPCIRSPLRGLSISCASPSSAPIPLQPIPNLLHRKRQLRITTRSHHYRQRTAPPLRGHAVAPDHAFPTSCSACHIPRYNQLSLRQHTSMRSPLNHLDTHNTATIIIDNYAYHHQPTTRPLYPLLRLPSIHGVPHPHCPQHSGPHPNTPSPNPTNNAQTKTTIVPNVLLAKETK